MKKILVTLATVGVLLSLLAQNALTLKMAKSPLALPED